jgi:uncharacterized integral membrane protein
MQIFGILALILAIVAIILLLQNLAAASMTVFLWNAHTSLAVLLALAIAAGVIITLLLVLPGSIRNRMAASGLKKKISGLEAERDALQKKAADAEKEVSTLEEQLASYSAALEDKQNNALK